MDNMFQNKESAGGGGGLCSRKIEVNLRIDILSKK